tara:strand:- start:126 stop:599 length:474 start_codon:yes stop_codon:yes gene_type:complete
MSGIINQVGARSGVIGTTEIDYEEGTFEPTYTATSLTVSGYQDQDGSYIKIGRLVHFQIFLATSGVSGGTTNSLTVTGLPFTSEGFTHYGRPPVSVGHTASWTTIFPGWAQVGNDNTFVTLMYKSTGYGATSSVLSNALTDGTNKNELYICGSYITP